MAKITKISANEILDSRGQSTIEVKVTTNAGFFASDSVPSGTSTGSFEAKAAAPKIAVNNVNLIIAPKLLGFDPENQEAVDQMLLDLDTTENKSLLGANSILGVSLAVARAGALSAKMPLYWHLNKLYEKVLGKAIEPQIPVPMMVMIEGGKHGTNNLCIQEFLVICDLHKGEKIWQKLKSKIEEIGLEPVLGLEGGFTPRLKYDEEAIKLIVKTVEETGLKIPNDIKLGLDVAANHCQIDSSNILTTFDRWPIYSLEDPVAEDDWEHWASLHQELSVKNREYLLIGDDLFTTNKKRLQKGIDNSAANAIIIKVNQVGTLWETLEVIAMAQKAGFTHILSHRSGETMDTFIADLACATAAKYMKSGAPFAAERVVKYNRLKEIAKEL